VPKALTGLLAALSLLVCLVAPVVYWHGALAEGAFRNVFAAASLAWFIFATWFAAGRKA
jgi:hypothetical protein